MSTEQLQQQLLEWIYGLLEPEEADALRRRVAEEPAVAEAYAQARRTAEVLAAAARFSAEPVKFAAPSATASAAAPKSLRKGESLDAGRAKGRSRWPAALVALAASLLVCAAAGGYWWTRIDTTRLAQNHLRLIVSGPSKLDRHVSNQFLVQTQTVSGDPLPARVEYALYDSAGKMLTAAKATTDAGGKLQAALPAGLPTRGDARLEVLAMHENRVERAVAGLAVDEPGLVTRLSLDKPLYQPGETVYYRSLSLGRFGMDLKQECGVRFEIHDPSGAVVPGSEVEGVTDRGVGNGAFALPWEIPGGQFSLVAKSLDGSFPEETRKFFVRQYRAPRLKKELEFARDSYSLGDKVSADLSVLRAEGGPAAGATLHIVATVDGSSVFDETRTAGPQGTTRVEFTLPAQIERGAGQLAIVVDDGGTSETIAKTIPINIGKVEVQFFPEGGDLVAGLASRVYFVGKDPLGKPVSIEGRVVDSHGKEVTKVKTFHKGLGAFELTPAAGQSYRLELSKPDGVTNQPALPAANGESPIVLHAGADVIEPGADLPLEIRTSKAGWPLVVSAYCRGVPVGTLPFSSAEGTSKVALPVSPEANGVLRVTVYDYSGEQPKPLAERLVFRRSDRRLNVRVAEHSERYTPGSKVELALVVTDEQQRAVPGALGVSVVDDSVIKLADDDTPSMSTHFFLTTEIEKPEDLEKADFYLSENADAPAALDMLLGTQGWRRFAAAGPAPTGTAPAGAVPAGNASPADPQLTRLAALDGISAPPAVYDNLPEVRREYSAALARLNDARERQIAGMARGIFAGSLAVVLAGLLLAVARGARSAPVWAPSLAAAAGCALFAIAWEQPLKKPAAGGLQVATNYYRWHEQARTAAPEDALAVLGDANFADDYALPDLNGRNLWGMVEGRKRPAEFDGMEFFYKQEPFDVDGEGFALGVNRGFQRGLMENGGLERDQRFRRFALYDRGLGFRELAKRQAGGGFGANLDLAEQEQMPMLYRGGRGNVGRIQLREARRNLLAAAESKNEALLRQSLDQLEQQLKHLRFPVRQYAHAHLAGEPGVRSDFAETVCWQPLLVADSDGRATLSFELPDSVTTFRVHADAHDGLGRIGSGSGELISRIPFSLEPKIPLEVTSGDRIGLPVAVINDTDGLLLVDIALQLAAAENQPMLRAVESAARQVQVGPAARQREIFELEVVGQKGQAAIEVRGTAGTLVDAKRQSLAIVPPGFPVAESYAGKLAGEQQVSVRVPQRIVPGSLEVTLAAYPSTLADLQRGAESILREPVGCFEQASTSNYPNVLSLQYLQEHNVANPDLTRRGKELLQQGYARLTAYECPQKGYEWFGGDPGHEALTAYGLMEFRDMSKVYPVDETMLARTVKWLLDRRDGKGGFVRNARALDSFGGAPEDITNAYIVWALAESGQKGLDAELNSVVASAKKSNDPYLLALAGASAVQSGQAADGRELLQKLAQTQAEDGHLAGLAGSITRSGGVSLSVETTALAALAWLKLPEFQGQAQKAIEWIGKNRDGGGGFGSTQATILALKALVEHARANKRPVTAGQLIVKRGETVIATQAFGEDQQNTISIEGIAAKLEPGTNELAISLSGENQMPYTLDVAYRAYTPNSHPECALELTSQLGAGSVRAGETVPLTARLTNRTAEGQPMSVAILGLPAGLQARPDQLEAWKKAGTIDYYETRAREVICYWRSLAPNRSIDLRLDLVAEWPGKYEGPASRAYLYYTAERKCWNEPLKIEIEDRPAVK